MNIKHIPSKPKAPWLIAVGLLTMLLVYRIPILRDPDSGLSDAGFLINAGWILIVFAAALHGTTFLRFDGLAILAAGLVCCSQMLTHFVLFSSIGYTLMELLQQLVFYYLLFAAAKNLLLGKGLCLPSGDRCRFAAALGAGLLFFAVLLLQYRCFGSKEATADTVNQLAQISGELRYNTIHAIGHTLYLKLLLTGHGELGVAVIVQLAAVAAVYTVFFSFFIRRGLSPLLAVTLLLLGLLIVPEAGSYAYFRPWKDTPAAVCLCFVTYLLMRYREDGKITGLQAVLLGALLAWCYLFRLNGVVLLLICGGYFVVSFLRRRYYRQLCLMLAAVTACVLFVNVYTETVLHPIEQKNGFAIQVFGSGIAAMVDSGELTEEELAQVDAILSVDWMREHYRQIGKEALIWSSDDSERIAADPELAIFNNEFVLALGEHRNEAIRLYCMLMPRHFIVCVKDVFTSLSMMWMSTQAYLYSYFFQLILLLFLILKARLSVGDCIIFLPSLCNTVSIMISTITSERRYLLPTFMLLPVYLLYLSWKKAENGKAA